MSSSTPQIRGIPQQQQNSTISYKQRYKLTIQYDGSNYNGFQMQRKMTTRTIQEVLESTLLKILTFQYNQYQLYRDNIHNYVCIIGSSRTDTGVHAIATTAHVDIERRDRKTGQIVKEPYDEKFLLDTMNRHLPLDIRILKVQKVAQEPDVQRGIKYYHAQASTFERTYLYRIIVCNPKQEAIVFLQRYAWIVPAEKFELEEMQKAAKCFEGKHDFRSFMTTTRSNISQDTVRDLLECTVKKIKLSGNCFYGTALSDTCEGAYEVQIRLRAKSFLYNQCTRIVGALYEVATGKLKSGDILKILNEKQVNPKLTIAPACGLYLCNVKDYVFDS